MAVINRPSKDIRLAHQLRLIADGKLPVQGLRVKTPDGYVPAKRVERTGHDTYRVTV